MGWKFWQKKENTHREPKAKRLPKPMELPSSIGKYLVTKLHHDPDWVWNLKCVVRQREESRNSYDIRVFDEKQALDKDISVKNYDSLNEHAELILFDGMYEKDTGTVKIEEKKKYE